MMLFSKKQYLKSAIGVCSVVLSSALFAGQTTEASKVLIDDMVNNIEQTLIAVAESEKQAGNKPEDLSIELALPARQSANLGLVLEPDDENGLKVLSISPGGLAESLNIQQDDVIFSLNELTLQQDGSQAILAILQTLIPEQEIVLGLKRKGETIRLNTKVQGSFQPSFRISIGTDPLPDDEVASVFEPDPKADPDACGIVSVFTRPPETKRLYTALITHINGKRVLTSRGIHRLPPGKHEITLLETIKDSSLRRGRVPRTRPKILEIDVQTNTKYNLGVEFFSNKRLRPNANEYWEPLVWEVVENTKCKL